MHLYYMYRHTYMYLRNLLYFGFKNVICNSISIIIKKKTSYVRFKEDACLLSHMRFHIVSYGHPYTFAINIKKLRISVSKTCILLQ